MPQSAISNLPRGRQELACRSSERGEASRELRVPVAEQEAPPSSPLPHHQQQQVAGLLGDPGAVGWAVTPARWTRRVPSSMQEQHMQPSQPGRVRGEAGRTPRSRRPAGAGTPARSWRSAAAPDPGGGGAAWCGSRSRGVGAEPLELALIRWSPQRGLSLAGRTISCCTSWSSGGRPIRRGEVHAPTTRHRCQRNSVWGLTNKQDQRAGGSTRLTAASRASSWMERHNAR
jgi:hypothetical protein